LILSFICRFDDNSFSKIATTGLIDVTKDVVTTQSDTTNQSQSTNVPNVVNSDQVKADIKQTNTKSDSVTQKQISN
jgi:hypothetical protein